LIRLSKTVGKRGGFQTSEPRYKGADHAVAVGHAIEARQVDVYPEHALDARSHLLLDVPPNDPASESDGQIGNFATAGSSDGEPYRRTDERKGAPVRRPVPAVHGIARPTP